MDYIGCKCAPFPRSFCPRSSVNIHVIEKYLSKTSFGEGSSLDGDVDYVVIIKLLDPICYIFSTLLCTLIMKALNHVL